jgi:hypothetical protein
MTLVLHRHFYQITVSTHPSLEYALWDITLAFIPLYQINKSTPNTRVYHKPLLLPRSDNAGNTPTLHL